MMIYVFNVFIWYMCLYDTISYNSYVYDVYIYICVYAIYIIGQNW